MKRILIPALLLGLCTFNANSKTLFDSTGVSISGNKTFILHRVEKGEGLYGIARKYQVNVKEIFAANEGMGDQIIIGQIVKVPVTNSISKSAPKPVEQVQIKPVSNPKKEEAIKVPEKTIVNPTGKTNPANSIVKTEVKEPIKTVSKPVKASEKTIKKDEVAVVANPVTTKKPNEILENGIAVKVSDDDIDQLRNIALHKSAPVGTIIMVTNPMTNKQVFVRVVGNIPSGADAPEVLIKLTQTTAEKLGARDKKFLVKLSYLME